MGLPQTHSFKNHKKTNLTLTNSCPKDGGNYKESGTRSAGSFLFGKAAQESSTS